jgi:hypothetical protein
MKRAKSIPVGASRRDDGSPLDTAIASAWELEPGEVAELEGNSERTWMYYFTRVARVITRRQYAVRRADGKDYLCRVK